MKTIKAIQSEIDSIDNLIFENAKLPEERQFSEKKYKSLNKKQSTLRTILEYLKTNPSEEFLKNDADRLMKLIKSKEDYYPTWLKSVEASRIEVDKQKSHYEGLFNLKHYRTLLKTTKYLLSD